VRLTQWIVPAICRIDFVLEFELLFFADFTKGIVLV